MTDHKYNFYSQAVDTPLSLALGLTGNEWGKTILGELAAKTNKSVYLEQIQPQHREADYYWRVVDADYSVEDSLMTYFKAYGLDGSALPQAVFGVTYGSVPQTIGGGFRYQPSAGNRYYVPVENNFQTQETGGYKVTVLDLDYPSESLAFGTFKQGEQHQNMVISFRLFARGAEGDYPHDLDLEVR